MVKDFSVSARGASHIKKDKECQDRSYSYSDNERGIIVVCDGHGGDDYLRSAVGAYAGCRSANFYIGSFLYHTDRDLFFSSPDEHLKQLESDIVNRWRKDVERHAVENPFTEGELTAVSEKARAKYLAGDVVSAYGTTLLAVGIGIGYWFGLHIGDGRCVAVNPEGKFLQPIPWDKRCFLNATTSICDADAPESFRHFYAEKMPVAVFIGSDGVDDSFANREQLHALYKTVLYSFATEAFDVARKNLEDYLPRLSEKGSGDDVSIAALMNMEAIKDLDVVKNFDVEKKRSKVTAARQNETTEEEKSAVAEMAAATDASAGVQIGDAEENVDDEAQAVEIASDSEIETPAFVPQNEASDASGECGKPA